MKLSGTVAILLVTIVALFAAACGSGADSEFVTYTDDINGFSISVPADWEPASDDTGVYFIGSSTCGGGHYYGSVATTYSEGHSSGQSFYTEVLDPYIKALDNYELISRENITIDSIPAIKAIYTYVDSYGYPVQQMACVLVHQQTAWVIGGTCATTCWNTYQGTFNTMSNSFRLLN